MEFASVVDENWVRNSKQNYWTHYWALRQQPVYLRLLSPPSWWWGVVFENWIVVASIEWMRCPRGSGFILCNFVLWFYCVCKCLRAHGGCLGIESR